MTRRHQRLQGCRARLSKRSPTDANATGPEFGSKPEPFDEAEQVARPYLIIRRQTVLDRVRDDQYPQRRTFQPSEPFWRSIIVVYSHHVRQQVGCTPKAQCKIPQHGVIVAKAQPFNEMH